ncbi:hypothetical protein F652_3103 [Enterobacteriaceae bacterium bta3-1]|nr:hypothetical protein F652_3103 [Enterobacteriaceae bacterium bta3-1]
MLSRINEKARIPVIFKGIGDMRASPFLGENQRLVNAIFIMTLSTGEQ